MATEKNIQICGKQVTMRYCAATETGYEKITGKSSAIFVPEIEKDEEGNIKEVKRNATTEDYIILAVAAIIAAYQRKHETAPVTADDIIYEASPAEVTELLKTICELRNEWYNIPSVVNTDENMTDDEKEVTEKEEKN